MGVKRAGRSGYTPIEILRYFYGSDMYINTAEEISGIPSSWPGYTLENGSSGAKVRQLQEQLECDRRGVSGAAKDSDRRSVWTGNCGGGQKVSGNFWIAADRNRGLPNMV